MIAGMTHHVKPDRLNTISKSIPKVMIVTGDIDHLVAPSKSAYLKKHMPEAEFEQWEVTGHAIHLQRREKFNAMLERVFKEGEEKVESKTK